MALPAMLKNFNTFLDGRSYLGKVTEVTLPKLKIKTDAYRAGGMDMEVDTDMGMEKMEISMKLGGLVIEALTAFGATNISGTQLRFAGAYQADDSPMPVRVEVIVRGRITEIDMGNAKAGDKTDHNFVMPVTYYKLKVNGATLIEIDAINMVRNINGNDNLLLQRLAIGI